MSLGSLSNGIVFLSRDREGADVFPSDRAPLPNGRGSDDVFQRADSPSLARRASLVIPRFPETLCTLKNGPVFSTLATP